MSSKLAIGLTDVVKVQQENLMTDNEKKNYQRHQAAFTRSVAQ